MNPSSNLSDLSGQGKSSVEYEYYKKQYNIVIKDQGWACIRRSLYHRPREVLRGVRHRHQGNQGSQTVRADQSGQEEDCEVLAQEEGCKVCGQDLLCKRSVFFTYGKDEQKRGVNSTLYGNI